MKRIGLFGGCFNPPNNLHIEIANNLIKENRIDKVIFIPVNDCYKKENLIEAKHRFNMLKQVVDKYKNIEVDDIELQENRNLFAVDIFEILRKKYSNYELYMIMGSDNFDKMPTWKDYDKIKNKYNYIVIDRDKKDISSSQIRNMIKRNDATVKEFLPLDVYKYIIENDLYKN